MKCRFLRSPSHCCRSAQESLGRHFRRSRCIVGILDGDHLGHSSFVAEPHSRVDRREAECQNPDVFPIAGFEVRRPASIAMLKACRMTDIVLLYLVGLLPPANFVAQLRHASAVTLLVGSSASSGQLRSSDWVHSSQYSFVRGLVRTSAAIRDLKTSRQSPTVRIVDSSGGASSTDPWRTSSASFR
jgi:hypothetical protein